MGPADRSLPPLHRHHHADPGVMVVGDAPAMTGLLDVGLRRLPPKQENHDQGREGQHEDQKGVVGVAEGAHDPMDRAPAPRSATPSGSVVPDSYPGHEKTGTKSHEFGGPRWGSLRQLAVKRFAVKRFQPGISRQARVPVRPRVHAWRTVLSRGVGPRTSGRAALALAGHSVRDTPAIFSRYDPPWTPAAMRRNEVMLELTPDPVHAQTR